MVIVVLVRWNQDISDDLKMSAPALKVRSEKRDQAYVSGTVVGRDIEYLDVVVVNLDRGLVDAYIDQRIYSTVVLVGRRTVKQGNLGLFNSDVQGRVGQSSRNLQLLLEPLVPIFKEPNDLSCLVIVMIMVVGLFVV